MIGDTISVQAKKPPPLSVTSRYAAFKIKDPALKKYFARHAMF